MTAVTVSIDTAVDPPLWLLMVAWRSYGALLAPDWQAWYGSTVRLLSVKSAPDPNPQPLASRIAAIRPKGGETAARLIVAISDAGPARLRWRLPSGRRARPLRTARTGSSERSAD